MNFMKRGKIASPLRIALRRLKRHKIALTGLVILSILYLSAIFADFLAPYPYYEEFRQLANHPPTFPHFLDKERNFHLIPFVYSYQSILDTETYKKIYVADKTKIYKIRFFIKRKEYDIGGKVKEKIRFFGVDEGGYIFLFGTDSQGRDIFSRILYGGRISLSIGLVGVFISFLIGLIIGGISGYFGGAIDYILMRITEIIMTVPALFLMLALRAAFLPLRLTSTQVYLMLVIIMSFISWASLARVIRGMVLSLREREFVLAARALGVSHWHIIVKHILPNTFSFAIISATLSIPGYILGESALSMLGLGIVEPQASWGNMLSAAKNIAVIELYPWILIPGFFIFIAILSFNLLGDGLRDAFDPSLYL